MPSNFYPRKCLSARPNVWIGSLADARDLEFMRAHNVQLVVNCTRDIPFFNADVCGFRVGVNDALEENDTMLSKMSTAAAAVDAFSSAPGQSVLVHCYAGMQRSCAIAAAFLMKTFGMSADEAMAAVRADKDEAFRPRPTFHRALRRFEKL